MRPLSLIAITVVLLAAMAAACASTGNPGGPKVFAMVQDASCNDVIARVRRNLQNDPELSTAAPEPLDRGLAFDLPLVHRQGLRFAGTVSVECMPSQATRVSVVIDARRLSPDGDWLPYTDTAELEQDILQKVTAP